SDSKNESDIENEIAVEYENVIENENENIIRKQFLESDEITKLSTICCVHDCTVRITREFTLKQLTVIAIVENNDPTIIIFLKSKVFVPIDETVQHYIEPFEIDNDIYLSGKNLLNMNLLLGLNVMISDQTTQTIKIVDEYSTFYLYVEKRFGDREPSDFWIEVKYLTTNSYISSKTCSINQNLCSTTAILVGTFYHHLIK
ncbi:26826_t:CDS:2, partial [Gigaspora margarita]